MTTRIHLFGGPLTDQLVYPGRPKWTNGNAKLRRMNLSYWEDNGSAYTYVTPRRPQEKEGFNQPHYEILNEWKISNTEKLHNTVFYYDSHGYFDYDGAWADAATLRIDSVHGFVPTPAIMNAIIRGGVDLVQWGWLPRYELLHEQGELIIGGEYRYHHGSHWGKVQYAEGFPSNYNPDYRFYNYD